MAEKNVAAPAIVQNLNMASDLYGDRSNIRNPYDTGVQLFKCDAGGGPFTPLRSSNTHLLNGELDKRPSVGCDFMATFNWSSFLPKGFASDQFYYAVTSIGITPVIFGKVQVTDNTVAEPVMDLSTVSVDEAAQGFIGPVFPVAAAAGGVAVQAPGQVLASMFRATFAGAWMEYKQDGRKTAFVFDHLLNIPAPTTMNDAAGIGLSLQSNRAMLPVPFLLSPRNTNQSQEVVEIHFSDAHTITDLSGKATTAGGKTQAYALVYKLDFGGFFCDASGNPADQEFTLANARLAADFRPIGG